MLPSPLPPLLVESTTIPPEPLAAYTLVLLVAIVIAVALPPALSSVEVVAPAGSVVSGVMGISSTVVPLSFPVPERLSVVVVASPMELRPDCAAACTEGDCVSYCSAAS